MIKAEIVAHSLSPQKEELITVLATFPRIILAEVNTHRMLSKNTSSSRAIPFEKMVEAVKNNPFIPIAWQKDHKGMQGFEYITDENHLQNITADWLEARDFALATAGRLNEGFYETHEDKVTKQLCNRLLEPFMWTTMLITGSREGWDNFFNLRCPVYEINNLKFSSKKQVKKYLQSQTTLEIKDDNDIFWLQINKGQAEIHMMALAEVIWDAVNESTPRKLDAGEWHIPFADKIGMYSTTNDSDLEKLSMKLNHTKMAYNEDMEKIAIKVSVAMAARTSYTVVGEEKDINYKKMIELHDRLIAQDPPHSSPMEHCAKAMSNAEYESFYKGQIGLGGESGWCNNFKGFIPYRYMIDNKIN